MFVQDKAEPGALNVPGWRHATWLIARRAALESLRDRTTLSISAFFALILPAMIVAGAIRATALAASTAAQRHDLGTLLAFYLLVVGIGPSSGSMSIASGVFAGEKEKGNLAPLLATPASNGAIFGGKVLGAVLPTLVYDLIAVCMYVVFIALAIGPSTVRLFPMSLTIAMALMVPAVSFLGATVASLFSSRVRTYNAAQMATSLAMLPVMAGVLGLAFVMRAWTPLPAFTAVLALVAFDLLLLRIGARTWRREEVMASQ